MTIYVVSPARPARSLASIEADRPQLGGGIVITAALALGWL